MKINFKKIMLGVSACSLFFVLTSCNNAQDTTKTSYTITYHLNGGVNDSKNPTSYTSDTEIIHLKSATNKRCNFLGWYLDSNFETPISVINNTMNQNLNLYAKYDGALIFSYTDVTDAITLFGKEIKLEYNEEYDKSFRESCDNLLADIKSGEKTFDEIYDKYEVYYNEYYFITDQYLYAEILADSTASYDYYTISSDIKSLNNEWYVYDEKFDLAFYDSVYKYDYYKDMTDEEIEAHVSTIDPEATATINAAIEKYEDVQTEYYGGNLEGFEAIKKYVEYANDYAILAGYKDYLRYSYAAVYNREYKVEDTEKISSKIDVFFDLYKKALKIKYPTTDAAINTYNSLYNDMFASKMDYLDAYANLLGGDYLENYNKLFAEGNYFLSDTENDNVTAYENEFSDGTPFVFFGKDCQAVDTFIHEFGHANAGAECGYIDDYDLAETQSQGNEVLFYQYLTTTDLDKSATNYFLGEQIIDFITSILIGFAVNETEIYIYENEDFTERNLKKTWNDSLEKFGLTSTGDEYMYSVLLNYPGYYFSYAASAIASLELFAKCQKDYNNALEIYKKIFENNELSFTEKIVNAGLYSVFDDECYNLIDTISF